MCILLMSRPLKLPPLAYLLFSIENLKSRYRVDATIRGRQYQQSQLIQVESRCIPVVLTAEKTKFEKIGREAKSKVSFRKHAWWFSILPQDQNYAQGGSATSYTLTAANASITAPERTVKVLLRSRLGAGEIGQGAFQAANLAHLRDINRSNITKSGTRA